MDKEEQRVHVEQVRLLLRRPVRDSTEEQKGNLKRRENPYRSVGIWKKCEIYANRIGPKDQSCQKRRLGSWKTAIDL